MDDLEDCVRRLVRARTLRFRSPVLLEATGFKHHAKTLLETQLQFLGHQSRVISFGRVNGNPRSL